MIVDVLERRDSLRRIRIFRTYLVIDFGAKASEDAAQSAKSPLPTVNFIVIRLHKWYEPTKIVSVY